MDGYVDQAFLRSYHEARGAVAWLEAGEADQKAAAQAAADWIDATFGARFSGEAVGDRSFPRSVLPGEIPTEVLFSAADAALAILAGDAPDQAAIEALLDPWLMPAEESAPARRRKADDPQASARA